MVSYLMMNINDLTLKIEQNERLLETLRKDCLDKIRNSAIRSQFRKVINRSQEHRNGSFIVLVVGPVKSGKSTLVNLIANAHVSPTHFLECTVRPSIISSNREGQEDNSLTTYISTVKDERVAQFDSIIDCLRGQEKMENIAGVKWTTYPVNPENIRDKVQLDLHDAASDETLVTSITTPGGKLLQKDVFVIDMPGFDGAVANMENNPIYKCIAERADLIIFVQSSNSAISKVANDFLNILKNNNHCVPVCLIHNVFEAAYWRSKQEKDTAIQSQLNYAYQEIKGRGFQIDKENCYCINLGKVEDARLDKYEEPSLVSEAEKYEGIEQQLHERVISNREYTRLLNCFNRTAQNVEILITMIENRISEMKSLISRYEKIEKAFDDIATDNHLKCYDDDGGFPLPTAAITNVVQGLISNSLSGIDENSRFRTPEAREIVVNFLLECSRQLSSILSGKYMYSPFYAKIVERELKRLNEINKVVMDGGGATEPIEPLDFEVFKKDIQVSLDGMVNIDHLVPWLSTYHRHDKSMVSRYLYSILDILVGKTEPTGDVTKSYLELTVIPIITHQVQSDYQQAMAERSAVCSAYLCRAKTRLLAGIIDHVTGFREELEALELLNESLKKVL